MIPNIVIPIPMPMNGGGAISDKSFVAIGIVIVAVGLLLSIIGFIYDGVRDDEWTLKDYNVNGWKTLGYILVGFPIITAIILWLVNLVEKML